MDAVLGSCDPYCLVTAHAQKHVTDVHKDCYSASWAHQPLLFKIQQCGERRVLTENGESGGGEEQRGAEGAGDGLGQDGQTR
eukprot:962431-Rhodomonas_salina.1